MPEGFNLPPNWREMKLGDVYKFTQKPRNLQYSDFEQIPFVPMELIPDSNLFFEKFILKPTNEISSGTYFEKGDVLLAKITPSFENGKQGIIENLPVSFGIATTEIIPIKEIPAISDKYYLFYYLLRKDIRSELAWKMEGSTGRQRLSKSTVENLIITFPPLPEQRAIARTLQAVQQAKEARQHELELERECKAALMDYLFTYGTQNESLRQTEIGEIPESWEVAALGTFSKIISGGTPDRSVSEYWSGNISWVKTGEINYSLVVKTEEYITEKGLENSSAKIIPQGTLLMAMYGQGVTRGRVAILGIDAAINQACAAIFISNNITEYVFYYLCFCYEKIRNLGHGANQQNLNIALVRSIPIKLPKINEQEKIAYILKAVDNKIIALEKEITFLEELFHAMLEELMTGRLLATSLIDVEENQ